MEAPESPRRAGVQLFKRWDSLGDGESLHTGLGNAQLGRIDGGDGTGVPLPGNLELKYTAIAGILAHGYRAAGDREIGELLYNAVVSIGERRRLQAWT